MPTEKKRTRKLLRIAGASTLALFMGLGTLCGVLIAPMGATSASNAGNLASAAQSADSALTPQEKLLAGTGLGLDPENDPVIYTTESGLDIKFGAATLSSGALSGYTYFTMGKIGSNNINWVIIGRSSSGTSGTMNLFSYLQSFASRSGLSIENSSPAAKAILAEEYLVSAPVAGTISLSLSSKEVATSEIPQGCVLAISECVLSSNTGVYIGSQYQGSAFQKSFTTLYDSGCGFTIPQKSLIQPVTLQTPNNTTLITSSNQYLFAFATNSSSSYMVGGTPNFCIETYLSSSKLYSNAKLIGTSTAYSWGLRNTFGSTEGCVFVRETSGTASNWAVNTSLYPRPGMVLRI